MGPGLTHTHPAAGLRKLLRVSIAVLEGLGVETKRGFNCSIKTPPGGLKTLAQGLSGGLRPPQAGSNSREFLAKVNNKPLCKCKKLSTLGLRKAGKGLTVRAALPPSGLGVPVNPAICNSPQMRGATPHVRLDGISSGSEQARTRARRSGSEPQEVRASFVAREPEAKRALRPRRKRRLMRAPPPQHAHPAAAPPSGQGAQRPRGGRPCSGREPGNPCIPSRHWGPTRRHNRPCNSYRRWACQSGLYCCCASAPALCVSCDTPVRPQDRTLSLRPWVQDT